MTLAFDKTNLAFAISENIKTLNMQFSLNSFDPTKFYIVNLVNNEIIEPGHHNATVLSRVFDIIGATYSNAIAIDATNGSDAIRLIDHAVNFYEEIECKVSIIDMRKTFVIRTGHAIRRGNPHKNYQLYSKSHKSTYMARWQIYTNNINSKNIPTIYTLLDAETWKIVDSYELDGDTVVNKLLNNDAGKPRSKPLSGISFSYFESNGTQVKNSSISIIGMLEWETQVRKRSTRKVGENFII